MGLSICVGFLADQKVHDPEGYEWAKKSLATISSVLKENQFESWDEPEEFTTTLRPHVSSFPYSWLHFLRRAYAWQDKNAGDSLPPTSDELSAEDDQMIEDASMEFTSHLLCHSDAEGHYVPVDFPEPIFDERVAGSMLGSSFALKRELIKLAPLLGIALEDGCLSDAEATRLHAIQDDHPLFRENIVFLTLWEVTRVSLEQKTAIVFC